MIEKVRGAKGGERGRRGRGVGDGGRGRGKCEGRGGSVDVAGDNVGSSRGERK